ncbi:MAG: type II secretion system protein GspC [Psychromonas sp.]
MSLSILLQKLPRIALILISLLLAYQLALLTWSLLPEEKSTVQWVAPKTSQLSSAKVDSQVIKEQHLFGKKIESGEENQKAEVEVQQKTQEYDLEALSKTKLNLTLVGVVAATDPLYSSAIISNKNKQESYFIDSEIEGTQASVHEVHADRIVLVENSLYSVLFLDGVEGDSQTQRRPPARSNNTSTKKTQSINIDRSDLLKNPAKLTNFIRISPVREGSEIKGYRVRPGKDPSIFKESGLQDGDLAVELNGIDLTDLSQSMSLMKEFPTMTEMSLTVERDGQLHELYFSIP